MMIKFKISEESFDRVHFLKTSKHVNKHNLDITWILHEKIVGMIRKYHNLKTADQPMAS